MTIAQELRDLAASAKSSGYRAAAEILRRMARDVEAGKLPAVRAELDEIVHAHARSNDSLARTWLAALRVVDGPVVDEPPPPPVYPGAAACEETSP